MGFYNWELIKKLFIILIKNDTIIMLELTLYLTKPIITTLNLIQNKRKLGILDNIFFHLLIYIKD